MPLHWNVDHHLNVFVLGPMPSAKSLDSSCRAIKNALEVLLARPAFRQILKRNKTNGHTVDIPEELDGAIISESVFAKIDAADLVVVNITPKDEAAGHFSPNVFYELGLVHALGIPYLLLKQEGTPIPFYFTGSRFHEVSRFDEAALQSVLREPLRKFLTGGASDFDGNPITDFYRLPVVDISAAVGAATGYFENFVRRALLENGFIGRNDGKFRHLMVVRPPDIMTHTFEQDFDALKVLIQRKLRKKLDKSDLPMIQGFDKRGLSGHFVKDIMIDLPTAAYTLKRSPRQQALEQRIRHSGKARATAKSQRLLLQASEKLLDQFESCLRFHMDYETGFRKSALTICSFRDLPSKLRQLLA